VLAGRSDNRVAVIQELEGSAAQSQFAVESNGTSKVVAQLLAKLRSHTQWISTPGHVGTQELFEPGARSQHEDVVVLIVFLKCGPGETVSDKGFDQSPSFPGRHITPRSAYRLHFLAENNVLTHQILLFFPETVSFLPLELD
jgi:hypothetical protein